MPTLQFEKYKLEVLENESVLECLTRYGALLPSSCHIGVCQTCKLKVLKGTVPKISQKGLKSTLVKQGYFLACICKPTENLEITRSSLSEEQYDTVVIETKKLNDTVLSIRLKCNQSFNFFPGQFVNLIKPTDNSVRSYSIASIPEDNFIELHIRKIPNGTMSCWLHNHLKTGDPLNFFGPIGDCFYIDGNPTQDILCIATGTGLAPIYGIVRSALQKGHTGQIVIYHGCINKDGLYYQSEFTHLQQQHDNVSYYPCVLKDSGDNQHLIGNIDEIVLQKHSNLKDWRVFVCGDPDIVSVLKKKTFLAGANLDQIFSDAFIAPKPI